MVDYFFKKPLRKRRGISTLELWYWMGDETSKDLDMSPFASLIFLLNSCLPLALMAYKHHLFQQPS
jgi:hypothetical protein